MQRYVAPRDGQTAAMTPLVGGLSLTVGVLYHRTGLTHARLRRIVRQRARD